MTTRPPGLKWGYFADDVLPAWVAEMDFGLAPPVKEALHRAVDSGDTGYPYPAALGAVAEAGARFWRERHGWKVDPERVFHAPDVIEGLRRAVMHLTAPGAPVIVPTPAYYPFFAMVARAGREMIQVRSRVDGNGVWRLDLDGIDRAFAAGAGSVVLCNPWNPVGRSLSESEVREVIAVASSHRGRVLADEVHSPLTYPGADHVVAATVDPETVVTVTAASKAWNIPGLKAAQVVLSNDGDVQPWDAEYPIDKSGAGTFGLLATAAAYAEGTPWLDEVVARLDGNRHLLARVLSDLVPGAQLSTPAATYLAWIDLSAYGWDMPGQHLLEHARVAVSEGTWYGPGGEGHIRFNFATAEANLVEIVERIAAAVA